MQIKYCSLEHGYSTSQKSKIHIMWNGIKLTMKYKRWNLIQMWYHPSSDSSDQTRSRFELDPNIFSEIFSSQLSELKAFQKGEVFTFSSYA